MISWLRGGLTVPEVPVQKGDDVVGVELGLTPGVEEAVRFLRVGVDGDFFSGAAEGFCQADGMLRRDEGIFPAIVQEERSAEVFRVVDGGNGAESLPVGGVIDISHGEGIFSGKGAIYLIHLPEMKQ